MRVSMRSRAIFDPIDSAGYAGVLLFQKARARLEFPYIVTRFVDRGSDIPQMIENDVVACLAHKRYSEPETD